MHNRQHVVQIGTFGQNVADRINQLLAANRAWRLETVHAIEVSRIGGPDRNVLAVFVSRHPEVEVDVPFSEPRS